jgi:hypothetical protein
MIQSGEFNAAVSSPIGGIFFGGAGFTFPVDFFDASWEIAFGSIVAPGVTGLWPGSLNAAKTVSGCSSMYIYCPINTQSGKMTYVAKGRWKA